MQRICRPGFGAGEKAAIWRAAGARRIVSTMSQRCAELVQPAENADKSRGSEIHYPGSRVTLECVVRDAVHGEAVSTLFSLLTANLQGIFLILRLFGRF